MPFVFGLLTGRIMALRRGERAPDFVLPLVTGTLARFYGRAGGDPCAVFFCTVSEWATVGAKLAKTACIVPVFVVFDDVGDASEPVPDTAFVDAEGTVRRSWRLDESPVLCILDANLRTLNVVPLQEAGPADLRVQVLPVLDGDTRVDQEVTAQAPVLLITDAIDSRTSQILMDVWARDGNRQTGVELHEAGRASREERLDRSTKRRRDHRVGDETLTRMLSSDVGRRVLPEVYKAFAYRATRFEGFKIACYDAVETGFFGRHRDNLSPSTAHRRFALTINLNGDYEGGELRFPEYGSQRYRPGPGSGIVFSCSHLHEVLPVTFGQRFALLSFLYADSEDRRP